MYACMYVCMHLSLSLSLYIYIYDNNSNNDNANTNTNTNTNTNPPFVILHALQQLGQAMKPEQADKRIRDVQRLLSPRPNFAEIHLGWSATALFDTRRISAADGLTYRVGTPVKPLGGPTEALKLPINQTNLTKLLSLSLSLSLPISLSLYIYIYSHIVYIYIYKLLNIKQPLNVRGCP